MSSYILHLYRQYCESLGKEYIELNIFNDFEFINWLEELYKRTILYGSFIDNMGVIIGKYSSIELGKGKYDSLGIDNTTIVSPFSDTLGLPKSCLIVNDNSPIIISNSKIYNCDCNSFITHNPCFEKDINNLILLHNMGLNICLGVYGDINDKDKVKKLQLLKNILSLMNDDIELLYDTDNTNYFSCIKSKRKVRTRILTK